MDLQEYSRKRDFENTPEPEAETDFSNQFRFVVQRHRASRLHYDLRLELDGVLKSWAVPKGPSMEKKVKRLAVQTEDHPVRYLTFEGTIPKGNYGAGTMTIWDSGIFKPAETGKNNSLINQWKKGSMKIIFEGKKLKGEFALVKTGPKEDKNWLLIKKEDEFSTSESYDAEDFAEKNSEKKNVAIQKFIKPMLASPKKEIFNNPGWIFEFKWDGYRMIASVSNGKVKTFSRNGTSFTNRFRILSDSLQTIPHDVILDGEVVALNKEGAADFQALQNYPENNWERIHYYVFDLLFLNGYSTMDLLLTERKSLIPAIIENCSHVFYCEEIEGMGITYYQQALEQGMEGVVAKKMDSVYIPGFRSKDWLKIKARETTEALICGYTDSDAQVFGSLLLGIYEKDRLTYIGNCGSGFSQQLQKELLKRFRNLEQETSPFEEKINLKGRTVTWLKPLLVAEISFSEWTATGKLRHPVFEGLREDKNPKEISRQEEVEEPPENPVPTSSQTSISIDGYSVPFSILEKIYFPGSGYTKYDLIDYYIHISKYLLPYLKDRPQNLHRHPNGITGMDFYQKNIPEELVKPWMETAAVYSTANKENLNYLLCQNEATLLYLINLGCIEINPWNSRITAIDYPDYAILDLDPSSENSFEEVIETALAVREVMDLWKIPGFCKTSGSSGIHILIPLGAGYTYNQARGFAKLICLEVQKKLPGLTTLERTKTKRKNKIYLDFLQNRKGQTLAAPYCVRPKEGAPVSAPLEWKEVKPGLEIRDFTIRTMIQRLQKKGDLWRDLLKHPIDLRKILESIS